MTLPISLWNVKIVAWVNISNRPEQQLGPIPVLVINISILGVEHVGHVPTGCVDTGWQINRENVAGD